MKSDFKIIAFDADDTLWVNEPYYRETEKEFCRLLSGYRPEEAVSEELFATEMRNLQLYGFGGKGFMLSMVETALRVSENQIEQEKIGKIIDLGKGLLDFPIDLIDGIEEILERLSGDGRRLIVVTKGDLLDQERKLRKSRIEGYFSHIEIMSDKKESDYIRLLNFLGTAPEDFLMIGNSLKSDIIPVLNIGGYGIHVPFHTTWQHEMIAPDGLPDGRYREIDRISDLAAILRV